jgi:protein TonB
MLKANVMGSVAARYIVDTTGFADSSSFEVIRATNKEFIDAVRAALPYMRFSPAKIGKLKVRQLVEQEFTFKIQKPVVPNGADVAHP